jgi:hypothetical protein
MDGQHGTESGPSWDSNLPVALCAINKVSNAHEFSYNYFVTGEDEQNRMFYSYRYAPTQQLVTHIAYVSQLLTLYTSIS